MRTAASASESVFAAAAVRVFAVGRRVVRAAAVRPQERRPLRGRVPVRRVLRDRLRRWPAVVPVLLRWPNAVVVRGQRPMRGRPAAAGRQVLGVAQEVALHGGRRGVRRRRVL